jgi:hypothetical protein
MILLNAAPAGGMSEPAYDGVPTEHDERGGYLGFSKGSVTLHDFIPGPASAASAARRAAGKLERAGLITDDGAGGIRQRPNPRGVFRDSTRTSYEKAVRLTDLGRLVVDTFRRELETDKRIRWAKLAATEGEGDGV